MTYDADKVLRSYRNIRIMLNGIPRQLWYIFLPESAADLAVLETNILSLRSREIDREKVITIQKMCGFPLRPNVPLREAVAKLKIEKLKKGRYHEDYPHSDARD